MTSSFSIVARCRLLFLLVLPTVCWSCSNNELGPAHRKETSRVFGKVTVDGEIPQPGKPIQIEAHPDAGVDTVHPTFSSGVTTTGGEFELNTYDKGDGVPVGKYTLTLYWGELNPITKEYGGPCKLNDRYRDPETSEIKFEVTEGGEPIDLGVLELTTE